MTSRGEYPTEEQDQQLETSCHNLEIEQMQWVNVLDLLLKFCEITEIEYERKYVGNRVKQWLAYLRRQYQLADVLFEDVKRLKWPEEIASTIQIHQGNELANKFK